MTTQIELIDDSEDVPQQTAGSRHRQTEVETDAELVELWLSQKSEETQRTYRHDVGQEMDYIGRTIRSTKLEHLVAWAQELARREYARSTQCTKLSAIRSLYSFAHRVGYTAFNVGAALRLPKSKDTLGEKILSEAEVQRIIGMTSGRDRVLLATLYGLGVRVSEAVGLTWNDLQEHRESGVAVVFGKGSRTRTTTGPCTLWDTLCDQKKESMAGDWPVFVSQKGGSLDPSQVFRIVRKAARRAGINTDERPVSPHWFRHSHASHALDRGAPIHLVQSTLGHESLGTTSRYVHARPDESSGDYLSL